MKKSIYTVDQIDALLSGKGMAILGQYGSTDEITDPVEGGHYYIGTEEPYDVYTYINGAWVNAGPLAIPGPPGTPGPAGSNIQSIDRTAGDGSSGSIDTYTVTLTNGGRSTFSVYNGKDGSVRIGDLADWELNILRGFGMFVYKPGFGVGPDGEINVERIILPPGVEYERPKKGDLVLIENSLFIVTDATQSVNIYVEFTGINLRGNDGDGISKIEQTKRAEESGGVNEITITTTSGNTAVFYVKNGEKGDSYILTEADRSEIAQMAATFVDPVNVVQETGTSTEAVMSQKAVTDQLNGYEIPDYWQDYLNEKISDIKALQDEGGHDCFSFVVMTDLHYPSNLGKRSPDLARKIMDEINAKYAFCLGDVQTRGCWHTKEEVLDELAEVEAFFAPIKNRLLRTQGNHDGSYGWLDRDGDGQYTNTGKEPADRETYVNNLTPAEIFERIYRPNGMVGDIHTDESGTGYYIDDTANKVRYIVLNTQKNDYELQEDGTQKYPNMWLFRFTQSQFDFLSNEALVDGLTDAWNVVVFGHCPLYQEIGDREVMQGVLNAYKNKKTYKGSYAGTADGETVIVKGYTNQLPISTADASGSIYNGIGYKDGARLSSSYAESTLSGAFLTGFIPVKAGDVVRLNGNYILDTHASASSMNNRIVLSDYTTARGGWSWSSIKDKTTANQLADIVRNDAGYIVQFTINPNWDYYEGWATANLLLRMTLLGTGENCVITVNEEIKETIVTTGGYDSVFVNADFSNAKGNLVGYFAGHVHVDNNTVTGGVPVITTRCDAKEENTDALKTERVAGTTTEQSFDVFTVNTKTKTIHATKIGAGNDRTISY